MRWAGGDLPELVAGMFGTRPIASARVGGGDINDAYKIRLANATTVFVKTRADAQPGWYRSEADGLAWLGETNTVQVPTVLGLRDDPELAHRFLVLEWIERAPPAPDHDERLGHALGELHRFPCARFGAERAGSIASLPLPNEPAATWPEFYARRRLEPFARSAVERGLLPTNVLGRIEALAAQLPELLGPPEPPARLHGDLWAGNAMTDARGWPVLVDPAAFGGHREVDLAMMQLFGGFGPAVFHAYDEVHPRAPDHERRVPIYQLYPLLVHVNLFGRSYAAQVGSVLDRYVP